MADIVIVEAHSRRQIKEFVAFPFRLYADCPYFVPPLVSDEIATLDPRLNIAYEHLEAKRLLAYRGNQIVGRLAVAINQLANQTMGTKDVRFGWFDCIEDFSVAEALFKTAEAWAREKGMETCTGPLGFSPLDREGMLLEGFDCLPTFVTTYNYPYYNEFVARLGFEKQIDTVEYTTEDMTKNPYPPKLAALVERFKQRGHFHVVEFDTRKELMARVPEWFQLFDETYSDLEGYFPLTPAQRDLLIKRFIPTIPIDLVKLVVNRHDELVGFIVAMPSLSRAMQKAKGRLFPFGFYHIWRAIRSFRAIDFLMTGVRKSYRGRGVDLIMEYELIKTMAKLGVETTESNPELETNVRIRSKWKYFNSTLRRRRRIYRKVLAAADSAVKP